MDQEQTILTTCPKDCYDACGMSVVVNDGVISNVRGDPNHPVSRGKLCKKCSIAYNSVWRDPEARLTQPLHRIGSKGNGEFESITWDEAINTIASRFNRIIKDHGAHTILNTHYTGTFAMIGFHFPMRFFNRLGATEVNPDSVCNLAGHIALDYVYGSSLDGFDSRTAKDSNCIVVWGANPSACAPHIDQHWLQGSDAKIIVVDPIRTPTAANADLYLQPFPGSDAALAFGIMHVLNRDGLLDKSFIDSNTNGFEKLLPVIESFTVEMSAEITGVPVHLIEELAKTYAEGPSLLWFGQGFQRQARGGNAMRACSLLPALTGNIGKTGAGFLYLNGLGNRNIDDNYLLGSHLAKNEAASISHMDLVNTLEDKNKSQALFCWNINNAASNPDQARLKQALCREDLFTVVADIFPTDTTDYADIVLPAASFLESDDLFASYFDHSLSAQVKVTEPMGDSLPNSEMFRRLAKAMDFEEQELYQSDQEIIEYVLKESNTGETFVSLSAKGTVSMSDDPVVQFADLNFPTSDGRIHLSSTAAEADGQPLVPEPHADVRPVNDLLRLLSPASPWLINDSFGNDPKIEKQLGEASVAINPKDAASRELTEGQTVLLHNKTGKLTVKLKLDNDIPIGVALSHKGRWPNRQADGANVNVLNPGMKSDMGESTCVHGVEVEISAVG
jgi:anaerobic selenocysteine-containing dehydrogenase